MAAQPARTSTLPDFTGRAAEVAAAFEQYARLLRAMDHAGMAALFVPTGRVVNPGETPIVGPAAIDAFLERFADYKVVRYDVTIDRISVHGDSAVQSARFAQRVRVPARDTIDVTGRIRARLVRDPRGLWRVVEMGTVH